MNEYMTGPLGRLNNSQQFNVGKIIVRNVIHTGKQNNENFTQGFIDQLLYRYDEV